MTAWLRARRPAIPMATAALCALALLAGAVPASAAPPGLGKIAFTSNRTGHYNIYAVDADGRALDAAGGDNPTRLTAIDNGDDVLPNWSPDGTRIVFVRDTLGPSGRQGDIWVMNADGSGQTRLTATDASEQAPAFSPDGTLITYRRQGEVWLMKADGGAQRPLTLHALADTPSFSPDGRRIVFVSTRDGLHDPATNGLMEQIYTLDVATCQSAKCVDGPFTRLTPAAGCAAGAPGPDSDNRSPGYSPDGRHILFRSTRCAAQGTGRDVFVMGADGSSPVNLTSVRQADRDPSWAPDGLGIVYVSTRDRTAAAPGDENVYVASIDGTGLRRLTTSPADDTNPRWWFPPAGLARGTPGSGVSTPGPGATAVRGALLQIALGGPARQRIVRARGRLRLALTCTLACRVTVSARGRAGRHRLRFAGRVAVLDRAGSAVVRLRLPRSRLAALRRHAYGRRGRRIVITVTASGRSPGSADRAVARRRVVILS